MVRDNCGSRWPDLVVRAVTSYHSWSTTTNQLMLSETLSSVCWTAHLIRATLCQCLKVLPQSTNTVFDINLAYMDQLTIYKNSLNTCILRTIILIKNVLAISTSRPNAIKCVFQNALRNYPIPKKDNICLRKSENGRTYGALDFVWNSSYSICNLILYGHEYGVQVMTW